MCIKFNVLGDDFLLCEKLPVEKGEKKEAWGAGATFNACCCLRRRCYYSAGVSLWHFVMCSAVERGKKNINNQRAAEGSGIYWLNFTVINVSFTSDIKKMMCSGGGGISKLVLCISGSRGSRIVLSSVVRINLPLSDKQWARQQNVSFAPSVMRVSCTLNKQQLNSDPQMLFCSGGNSG